MSDDDTTDGCSIAATLAAVGDRWTLLILRDLFRGVRRFERSTRTSESPGISLPTASSV